MMSNGTVSGSTLDLDALCAVIEREAATAEELSGLAPAVRDAAAGTGLWTLTAPAEDGGLQLDFPSLLDTFERLGEADPTAAWHAVNSIPIGLACAALDPITAKEVVGDSLQPFGYCGAILADHRLKWTEGGGILNGHWPFQTGAADTGWVLTMTLAEGAGGGAPQPVRVVVPSADLEIERTWQDASAMRGTGSHATSAKDVFVPDNRLLALDAPLRVDEPLYRVGMGTLFLGPVAAMAVGVLRSALAEVVAVNREKVSRFDGSSHADHPKVLATLVEAAGAVEAWHGALVTLGQEVWNCALEGRPVPDEDQARVWAVVFGALDACRRHVSDLYAVASSSVYATANPIERALRNIHAFSATFQSFHALVPASGRALLGLDPGNSRFR